MGGSSRHKGFTGRGLAATGFSYHPQTLPPINIDIDTIQGFDRIHLVVATRRP